ncbi:D-amino-acid dehydrogenase [Rhizobiales bacterium GAS113]|nr:D-amino-acid dehydrogenase [Rhizobiales bacterium GAS113]
MSQKTDVVVLGAGIIGVCIALHLQARGRAVMLVDRRAPGEETSHGNAGLIERSSVVPYAFPRNIKTLLAYATNCSPAVRYEPSFLPRILPWLARYWWHSSPKRLAHATRDMLPLIERSVSEHEVLATQAGANALIRPEGWIELYRSQHSFLRAQKDAAAKAEFALLYDILDAQALRRREPAIRGNVVGAIHWRDPAAARDPGALTRAYADLFVRRGGEFLSGDARTLQETAEGWSIEIGTARHFARNAVIALGPWSDEIYRPLGYRFPMAVKRGYHMHYSAEGGATLSHPVCDVEAGFVLAPMTQGIRLTTGIELAPRDAPPSPRQLDITERIGREIFPLGRPLDARAWLGSRPCFPDMKPIIGPALRHKGLWFAFGHAHHGFTLGPATGRLLAEAMTGEETFTDIAPYRADRFWEG